MEAIMLTEFLQQVVLIKTLEERKTKYTVNIK